MVALNETVRLVALQFSFSNPDVIPSMVKQQEKETKEKRMARKSQLSGFLAIRPTEKCSLVEFLVELERQYELVDAFYEERIHGKDPRGRRTYHMVRFLFARREFVEISDEFERVRGSIRTALSEMCHKAMWRIRAFSNPFYKDGEEILGQHAMSINLEARQPLFHPNGQPVVAWQKDESGKRVGDAPLPLKPEYFLRVVDDTVQLMTA